MLSLEKVKSELEKYNYTYDNNILLNKLLHIYLVLTHKE